MPVSRYVSTFSGTKLLLKYIYFFLTPHTFFTCIILYIDIHIFNRLTHEYPRHTRGGKYVRLENLGKLIPLTMSVTSAGASATFQTALSRELIACELTTHTSVLPSSNCFSLRIDLGLSPIVLLVSSDIVSARKSSSLPPS